MQPPWEPIRKRQRSTNELHMLQHCRYVWGVLMQCQLGIFYMQSPCKPMCVGRQQQPCDTDSLLVCQLNIHLNTCIDTHTHTCRQKSCPPKQQLLLGHLLIVH